MDKHSAEFKNWWKDNAMLEVSKNPSDYVIGYQNAFALWQSRQAEIGALKAANKDLQDWFDELKYEYDTAQARIAQLERLSILTQS